MTNKEFYREFGNIDPKMIEAAAPAEKVQNKKKNTWVKWGALAACLCLIIGAITIITHFGDNISEPQLGEIPLSDKTTAKVTNGCDDIITVSSKGELVHLTEEEMFARENIYVFRGTVSGLRNVTIDFNGVKDARCIATIVINEVYQGDLSAGEKITMLIPCAIVRMGNTVEDTDVITQLKDGMEGIFMPLVYDENSYIEMNGAVLMIQDLAACGLLDGMRWSFLDTERGLVFLRSDYPGAKEATNLDDIETYVIEMLK